MKPITLVSLFLSTVVASHLSAVVRTDMNSGGVWAKVKSDPYRRLPQTKVSFWRFASSRFNPSPDKLVSRAVSTTLQTDNLLPYFEKLVHSNGICLRGRWIISEGSRYTGYFAAGTNAPFVGRASSAFSATMRGEYRAFGLAGKIFHEVPGSMDLRDYQTANFFTIDDLAGTLAENFTEVELLNEPAFTKKNILFQDPSAAVIGAATLGAFLLADSNPGIRQLYEISELGLKDKSNSITPKWMRLRGLSDMKDEHDDFRDDLRAGNFEGPLRFEIAVSSTSKAKWDRIGEIVIEESVASTSCDHRLHFHHPLHRTNLKH